MKKVGFLWILGQGDILVMGDLSWVMYPPPRIRNFLWQIWLEQFMCAPHPHPEMKKLDFFGFWVKVIFWLWVIWIGWCTPPRIGKIFLWQIWLDQFTPLPLKWKSLILGQGDILVMGDLRWVMYPIPKIGRFDLTNLQLPGYEKVGFLWILGQGDILVMGDLSWAMYQFMPLPQKWKSWISVQGDIFVMGDFSWEMYPPSPRIGNYFMADLTWPIYVPWKWKIWILGQGDILVMGDLNWVMYPPPRIRNFLWQIWLEQFMPPPPPPRNEKVGFWVKVIFWLWVIWIGWCTPPRIGKIFLWQIWLDQFTPPPPEMKKFDFGSRWHFSSGLCCSPGQTTMATPSGSSM